MTECQEEWCEQSFKRKQRGKYLPEIVRTGFTVQVISKPGSEVYVGAKGQNGNCKNDDSLPLGKYAREW